MGDSIILIPDHCISIYFVWTKKETGLLQNVGCSPLVFHHANIDMLPHMILFFVGCIG